MEAADRSEAAMLLLRHWKPLRVENSHAPPESAYLTQAEDVVQLLEAGADTGRLAEYLARTGLGDRDEDREWRAAAALRRWYAHRVADDPWRVQVEFEIDEPMHHRVLEDVARRLALHPTGVTQSEGVLVVNTDSTVRDPMQAAREALQQAQANLPGPHLLYRVTVWRHVV